jgi:hypothetical protein
MAEELRKIAAKWITNHDDFGTSPSQVALIHKRRIIYDGQVVYFESGSSSSARFGSLRIRGSTPSWLWSGTTGVKNKITFGHCQSVMDVLCKIVGQRITSAMDLKETLLAYSMKVSESPCANMFGNIGSISDNLSPRNSTSISIDTGKIKGTPIIDIEVTVRGGGGGKRANTGEVTAKADKDKDGKLCNLNESFWHPHPGICYCGWSGAPGLGEELGDYCCDQSRRASHGHLHDAIFSKISNKNEQRVLHE